MASPVFDRSANSHRKASLPHPTTHETHTVASQKQLEGTKITRKGDPYPQVSAPPSKMMAGRRQCTARSTFTPTKTCSTNRYRHIKKRMAHFIKQTYSKGKLVPSRKQAAYQFPGTENSLLCPKRVPRPLLRQDSSCSIRQHHSGVMHKQGRRYEVGLTVCPSVENPDLVCQEIGDSQSLTHSRPADSDSRQTIQARLDHPNRVIYPSRDLPGSMQQATLTSNRSICHEVQQVASFCVTGTGPHGLGSGCTQSVMGGSGCICLPTGSHLGQSGGKVAGLPMQENHSDCPRVAQHAVAA